MITKIDIRNNMIDNMLFDEWIKNISPRDIDVDFDTEISDICLSMNMKINDWMWGKIV